MKSQLGLICASLMVTAPAIEVSSAASEPRAQLRHFVCVRAPEPASRAISVTAVIRPLPGTMNVALRFELVSSVQAAEPLRPVSGGDLGAWISPSNPTLGRRRGDVWILNKQVVDLEGPAIYRFRVRYRWTGSHHRVIGTALRWTATCGQPELRPDLALRGKVEVMPTRNPASAIYVATIFNGGVTAAAPFEVSLSPGGGAAAISKPVAGLAPHGSVQVRFLAPACSSTSPLTITVDPGNRVQDLNRANNSEAVSCAATAAPPPGATAAGR